MNHEQLESLIRRLETHAAKSPTLYQLKVGLLALLGYGYIGIVLLGTFGSSVGLILLAVLMPKTGTIQLALKLGLPLLVLFVMIVRALWVKFSPPEGREIKRKDAPELFALIDEFVAASGIRRVDHVLVTPEFNASVVEVPRLGVFGWHKNYLIVGLALMEGLSAEQFKAVIAHEFGHFSGRHSRFTAWIYRVRQTWIQLLKRLYEDHHWGAFVFKKFFDWYSPYFSAYSFVLARTQEYQADRFSAELTSAQAAAAALINTEVKAQYIGEWFWPRIYEHAKTTPQAPGNPYHMLFSEYEKGLHTQQAERFLQSALKQQTTLSDTHPCLKDRLQALGYPAQAFAPEDLQPRLSAARIFLPRLREELRDAFNLEWQDNVRDFWEYKYESYTELRAKLKTYAARCQSASLASLTPDELWDYIRHTLDYYEGETGERKALPILVELLRQNPNHHRARYAFGSILLALDDPQGIQHIEQAMKQDPSCVVPGCDTICNFYYRQGQLENASPYIRRIEEREHRQAAIEAEALKLGKKDVFIPHGLSAEVIASLQEQINDIPRVQQVYLVRKVLKNDPDNPVLLVGLVPKLGWWQPAQEATVGNVVQQLSHLSGIPGDYYVLPLAWEYKPFQKIFANVSGSLICQGGGKSHSMFNSTIRSKSA